MVPCDIRNVLVGLLDKLKQLRAKPQERLFILREVLLPRFHYHFSFYPFSARTYNDFDIRIRKFTRGLLHLPHDVPNSFFYASISDGGLGLFCSRWRGPLLRRYKLRLFARNFGGFSETILKHITTSSDAASNLLLCNNNRFNSGGEIADFSNILFIDQMMVEILS